MQGAQSAPHSALSHLVLFRTCILQGLSGALRARRQALGHGEASACHWGEGGPRSSLTPSLFTEDLCVQAQYLLPDWRPAVWRSCVTILGL